MSSHRDESSEGRASAFRFVHCADVHLDAPHACADDIVRARLDQEARTTLGRLVELCLQQRVHALLVAGDLFDDQRLSFTTEDVLRESFEKLTRAGVAVVLACGNHDSAAPGGRMAAVRWPRGVTVAGSQPAIVDVKDEAGRVVGRVVAVGHGGSHETARLVAALPPAQESVPSVAVLHGHVAGARSGERHEPLAPCNANDFTNAGHRYWALGHVHERQQVGSRPVAHYPGSLVPHGFAESGPRGALVVSLPAKGEPKVDFQPLCAVRFETLQTSGLTQARDLPGVRNVCAAAFETLRASEDRADALWMLRFELSGPCAAATECQRDELLEELGEELAVSLRSSGVLHAAVVDAGVFRPLDLASHAGRAHVLGEALALSQSLQDDSLLDRLMPHELAGCTPGSDKRAYVRGLLADIERAAGEALIREVST